MILGGKRAGHVARRTGYAVEDNPFDVGYWSPLPHKGVRVVDAWYLRLFWFQSDLKPKIKGLDF